MFVCLILMLMIIAVYFLSPASTEYFSPHVDPRAYGVAKGCENPGCDVACKKSCNVNYSGYEITPLRRSGYDVTPLHNVWCDPDYLSDSWCANPQPDYADPPYLDYHIKNPNYCYNLNI